ncbi:MAG: hypothetical protein WD176_03840, partial [Pirellulales bacterium]
MAFSLHDSSAAEAIRRALEQKTSFDFDETPLSDVVQFFGDKLKIQIVLDKKGLDDAGIGSDTPLKGKLQDVSLRSALNLLLEEHGMTFLIRDEVLIVTTQDSQANALETIVYDVRDLLDMDRQDRASRGDELTSDDYQSLIDMLTTAVAPTSWDAVGGPGSISPIYGMLVISQPQRVHEDIAKLLAWLRKVRAARGSATSTKAAGDSPITPADPHALTLKIYKVSVPLLPVAGGGGEEPTKPAVKGAEAGAVLKQFGGGQQPPKKQQVELPDPQFIAAVATALTATIEPESWDANGGAGVIRPLPADANGQAALVVRQTAAVHRQ